MPLISVIVPVYKVEPYLHRCVDSILAQSFTDYDLILVDDGSPDNCGALCDEYAAKDNRIHVIHQKNGGLSAARNAGIDWAFVNSDSQWLAFIDSDDWVHPCYLEYLFRAVQETGMAVSVCSLTKTEQVLPFEEKQYQLHVMDWDAFYAEDWTRGVVAWNKLYSKRLFKGLRYPVGRIHEDEFLTYRLLDRAGQIAVLDAELYYYFQNSEGITKTAFSLARNDSVLALREQCRFFKRKHYDLIYAAKMRDRLHRVVQNLRACRESNNLSACEKLQGERMLLAELRRILLADNMSFAPLKENQWLYEMAFPKLSWLYWTCRGVFGKLKRMVKK